MTEKPIAPVYTPAHTASQPRRRRLRYQIELEMTFSYVRGSSFGFIGGWVRLGT